MNGPSLSLLGRFRISQSKTHSLLLAKKKHLKIRSRFIDVPLFIYLFIHFFKCSEPFEMFGYFKNNEPSSEILRIGCTSKIQFLTWNRANFREKTRKHKLIWLLKGCIYKQLKISYNNGLLPLQVCFMPASYNRDNPPNEIEIHFTSRKCKSADAKFTFTSDGLLRHELTSKCVGPLGGRTTPAKSVADNTVIIIISVS